MTVISESISSIFGADDQTVFVFRSLRDRGSSTGAGLITARVETLQAVDGVLTTPDIDPGPAVVKVGPNEYRITIPDFDDPIPLWPLIEAGLPVSAAQELTAVKNGGGVAIAKRHTLAEYEALPSIDPDTLYVVPE